jgi:multiple sugar transport system ATP-binding protein
MNFINGQVRSVDERGATIAFAGAEALVVAAPGQFAKGDELTLGIRPEHMAGKGPQTIPLAGRIDAVERLGEASFIYMKLTGGDDVIVRSPGDIEAAPGEGFTAHVPVHALHVFDASGQAVRTRGIVAGEIMP